MERKPRPELQRRRSQRQSNGSNFEADFRLLQDSDDDPMTSNDSGMELEVYGQEDKPYSGLSYGDIKSPFNITRNRIRNTPTQSRELKCDAVIADSESSPQSSPVSTRAKRLSLFDSPHTPRSLVRRLSQGKDSPRWQRKGARMSRSPVCSDQSANINPFTPTNRNNQSLCFNSAKRYHTREQHSRYKTDFLEISRVGFGEFGDVFKVQNRLDGCVYAIKKTKNPIRGSRAELQAVREVCAHAVLDKHDNVVRYYSAWSEGDRMLIQSEFCDGGSLAEEILRRQRKNLNGLSDDEIVALLTDAAEGLTYIHSQNLAHLDIKPPNLLRSIRDGNPRKIMYKIGDLGHVSPFDEKNYDEGDCRYAAKELIQSTATKDLRCADIFSLGLSAFEAGTLIELKKNGDEWHIIRSSKFRTIFAEVVHSMHTSTVDLILRMTVDYPSDRLLASQIVQMLKREEVETLKRQIQYERNNSELLRSQIAAICNSDHTKLQRLKTL